MNKDIGRDGMHTKTGIPSTQSTTNKCAVEMGKRINLLSKVIPFLLVIFVIFNSNK